MMKIYNSKPEFSPITGTQFRTAKGNYKSNGFWNKPTGELSVEFINQKTKEVHEIALKEFMKLQKEDKIIIHFEPSI